MDRIVKLEQQLAAEKAAREKAEEDLRSMTAKAVNSDIEWGRIVRELEESVARVKAERAEKDKRVTELIEAHRERAACFYTTASILSIEKYGHPCDPAPDLEACKTALVKPLVAALTNIVRQLDYVDYELRETLTRLIDRALAAHKPCPTCEGTRTIQDHPIISCTDDAEEIEAKQQMGRRPCPTCNGTREIRERQPYPNESTIIVRLCPNCMGGKKD